MNEEGEDSENMFLSCNIAESWPQEEWYLDYKYSNDMTGKDSFVELNEGLKSKVKFCDYKALKMTGRVKLIQRNEKGTSKEYTIL